MALPCIIAGTPGGPTDYSREFRVTQWFGERPNVYGQGGHDGIDFAPKKPGMTGVRIRAPHEGWLTHGWDPDGYGLYALIVSDIYGPDKRRRASVLGHASEFLVPNGRFVYQLEDVMVMGNTGFSTNFHTHHLYYLTDPMGRKLNYDNGHKGALDIAGEIVVDKGRRLSEFRPAKTVSKAAKDEHEGVDGRKFFSQIHEAEYLPVPIL